MRYQQVWAKSAPLPVRMPSGKAYVHRLIMFSMIGWSRQRCFWCRRAIDWFTGLTVDHLDGDGFNNDEMNLVVACQRCNTLRGKGRLWLHLPAGPLRDRALKYGPVATEFPCGHAMTDANTYRHRSNTTCLTCHRDRAREHWRLALSQR